MVILFYRPSLVSPTGKDFYLSTRGELMNRFSLLNSEDRRTVPLLTVPQCHSWLAEKDLALAKVQGNFIPISTEVYTVYHLVGPDLLHEIYRNLWLSIACPWKWNANNAIKNNIESVCDNVHNDYAILDTHNFSCYCTERARIDFCGLM